MVSLHSTIYYYFNKNQNQTKPKQKKKPFNERLFVDIKHTCARDILLM